MDKIAKAIQISIIMSIIAAAIYTGNKPVTWLFGCCFAAAFVIDWFVGKYGDDEERHGKN